MADECHRYGSEQNKNALDDRFVHRLGLSATYRRNDFGNEDWLEPYFGSTCFVLGYKRAIADQVISGFSVALVGVAFSVDEKAEYTLLSKQINKIRNELISIYNFTPEPFGEFMKEVSIHAEGGFGELTGKTRRYLGIFDRRRKLLAECPAKLTGFAKLFNPIRRSNRTLVFTQTIESAEAIAGLLCAAEIEAIAMHSKIKGDRRRQIFRSFEAGELQVIVAPKVLDEGIDVPEANLGIIVAASKTNRQMIQRMGRVLRRKKDGRNARFVLLYVEETSEDPRSGAHEEFLDEICRVAKSVERFNNDCTSEAITRFFN